MTNEEFDMGGAAAPSDRLAELNAHLKTAIDLEQVCAQLESDLKAAKASLRKLKDFDIPDVMTEIGMDACEFQGWKVKVADFVGGGLPKAGEAHEKAIQWLEANGAEGLIKTDVAVAFGRSQHNEALSVAADLEKQGLPVNVNTGVHTQTLRAFARDRLRNGEPLDAETLGLFLGKTAEFKRASK